MTKTLTRRDEEVEDVQTSSRVNGTHDKEEVETVKTTTDDSSEDSAARTLLLFVHQSEKGKPVEISEDDYSDMKFRLTTVSPPTINSSSYATPGTRRSCSILKLWSS
jgi:hypothetical protein